MNKRLVTLFAVVWSLALAALADDYQYTQDFDKLDLGDPPEELMVLEGDFQVVAQNNGNHVLRLPAIPLEQSGALFGKRSNGPMTVQAKVWASNKRRSYPRFGIGVHGLTGYRLRLVPARRVLELVKDETEVVHTVPFQEWKSDAWCTLKLTVGVTGEGKTEVRGWVWTGDDALETPTLTFSSEDPPGQGKASIWGSPYSGKEIYYDALSVMIPEDS